MTTGRGFDMGMLVNAIGNALVRIHERGPSGLDMDALVLVLGELVEVAKHLAEVEDMLGIESELTRTYAEARKECVP